MLEQILITMIALATVLVVLFLLFKKPILNYLSNFSEKMAEKNLKMLEERNKETLKEERERFKELSDE